MDAICRVPECGEPATVGSWREPFAKYRWGVNLSVTVEDLAVQWPLCSRHGEALLEAALEAVGTTVTGWGLEIGHQGIGNV